MIGTTQRGQHLPSDCYARMQVKGAKFVARVPTKKGTLDCNPKKRLHDKLDLS